MPAASHKKRAAPSASLVASIAQTTSRSDPPSKKRKMDKGPKFYAVRAGFKPGVYTNWEDCQAQIAGFKGAQFKSFPTPQDAAAFVAGKNPPTAADAFKPEKFYGVAVGKKPGVYTEWADAQLAFIGTKGPKYRKFNTRAEAEEYVRSYGNVVAAVSEASNSTKTSSSSSKATAQTVKGEVITIYTDGSSLGNGKFGAAAGVGVFFGPGDKRNVSERLQGDPQTNQRAELMAILRALELVSMTQDVQIKSDSKYSIQCVTEWYMTWEKNGWMTRDGPVKNKDLVQAIRTKLSSRENKSTKTQFIWVKGHASDQGNIEADRLAVEGAKKPFLST